jgi:hypothetical protein
MRLCRRLVLRLTESDDSGLTLSEKRFCRQRCDMWWFDSANPWTCRFSADRRAFLALIGGAAAWPLSALAQQPIRRVGLLMSQNDPDGQARVRAFVDALQELGWTDSRNVRLDIRWAAGKPADSDK